MNTRTQMKRQQALLTTGYDSFGKGLNRYAASRTHDRALTDDLVQNTFLKTWKYLVRGGKIDMMEAFLYHVLKALIIDEYRKRKTVSLDVLIEKGFEPTLNETDRLENVIDGKQIADLIPQLPLLYRKVMRLRYLQDLSLKEISLITGQTRNTVAVQTHRGLVKLKSLYEVRATARNATANALLKRRRISRLK